MERGLESEVGRNDEKLRGKQQLFLVQVLARNLLLGGIRTLEAVYELT